MLVTRPATEISPARVGSSGCSDVRVMATEGTGSVATADQGISAKQSPETTTASSTRAARTAHHLLTWSMLIASAGASPAEERTSRKGGKPSTLESLSVSTFQLSSAQAAAVAELLRIAPLADRLGELFINAGYELYLVGGSVGEGLLGRRG